MKTTETKPKTNDSLPKFIPGFGEPKARKGWEIIGAIAVASGTIWISDPCRVFQGEPLVKNWPEFLVKIGMSLEQQQFIWACVAANQHGRPIPPRPEHEEESVPDVVPFDKGDYTVGLAIHPRFGDGYFPVEAKRDCDGRIKEISIRF